MKRMDKEDLLSLAVENDVKFVRLQFVDLFGIPKNVAVTIGHLSQALENRIMFDGSSVSGFAPIEASDMYLCPDPNTFKVFPWRPQNGRVARMICDVRMPDGQLFDGDPRKILRDELKKCEEAGFEFKVGPECEFFLFHTDSESRTTVTTHDQGGYFEFGPMDMGEDARRDICLTLEQMDFEVETSHHETAPGQHEIDFRFDDALLAADNLILFRTVVKAVASRHGLAATFMPKPIAGTSGSGLHINLSLWKDGKNIFLDPSDKHNMSEIAYSFMAGLLAHAPGITAITNPLVNSYKRLIPGHEAPTYISWATQNRSALIRIPAVDGDSLRVEYRSPDPTCNPYLAFAVILAAGLDGVKKKLAAPAPVEMNVYKMTDEQRKEANIQCLPRDLGEAIDALQADSVLTAVLGELATKQYIEAKRNEWEEYRTCVHQWELERYLDKY